MHEIDGKTTAEIATAFRRAVRTVQEWLQRARDYRQHLKQQAADPDSRDWVTFLMRGVTGYCKHGLPGMEDGTWLCDCMATNNPAHRAFHREPKRKLEKPKAPPGFVPKGGKPPSR